MGVVLVVLVVLVTGGKQSQLSPARLGLGLSLAKSKLIKSASDFL